LTSTNINLSITTSLTSTGITNLTLSRKHEYKPLQVTMSLTSPGIMSQSPIEIENSQLQKKKSLSRKKVQSRLHGITSLNEGFTMVYTQSNITL